MTISNYLRAINRMSKHRRHFFLLQQKLAIALLTFTLAITLPPLALGQIPFLSSPSDNQTQVTSTPWWNLSKARRCGKLLCSEVAFPYFPYSKFRQDVTIARDLTIAIQPQLDQDLSDVISKIEERALTVEETMLAIFQQSASKHLSIEAEIFNNSQQKLEYNWKYWLPTTNKDLHPLTPKVAIGIKNQQTVIYVPAQPDLSLSQQTILTVNQADALHNGQSIPKLAQKWRNLISFYFNQALWGLEFDLRYPWARIFLIALSCVLTLVPILLISLGIKSLRGLDRNYRKQLRLIEQAAKSEKIAASASNLSLFKEKESDSLEQADVTDIITDSAISDSKLTETSSSEAMPSSQINQPKKISNLQIILVKAKNWFLKKLQILLQKHPQSSFTQQNWLQQLHNLTQFLLKTLFWTRIFLFLFGISLIFALYPATRKLSVFFLGEAIILPIIWMLVSLVNALVFVLIDFYLNQWAEDAQIEDLTSTRYASRVNTYSPALKGASTFLFILLGIYLTVKSLEIDTAVLAGAGGAALILGFLSRNILEDMLNGALILWTDRYAVGDVIKIGELSGFVEKMNLYTTQLRGSEGRLITIPNGQISTVENLTKDWSRVDFVIEIAYDADTRKAIEIIEQVSNQMISEPQWQDTILEPASILGVEQIAYTGVTIKVWLKTLPIKQWAVGREFRLRIKHAFDEAGISPGIPQQIWRGDRVGTEELNS